MKVESRDQVSRSHILLSDSYDSNIFAIDATR